MACHNQSGLKKKVRGFLDKALQQTNGKINRRSCLLRSGVLAMFFVLLCGVFAVAGAQEPPPRVGGHVGIAFPIVTRSDGRTTTISEDFIVGFPVGIVIRNSSPFAFDFEFVPTINNSPRQDVTLTVHPGIVYGFKKNYTAGIRAAFDIGADAYGFTPLIQRSWKIKGNTKYFVEADFPVRFRQRPICAGRHPARSRHISAWPFSPAETKKRITGTDLKRCGLK
ncbi:MAG: hypothetical protein ACR2LC_18040 [Pyrinomonadaceae bacterium]